MSPAGETGEFVSQSPLADGITGGPDGYVWYIATSGPHFDQVMIGRIRPTERANDIVEFALPTWPSIPSGITSGPDGNIWFTEIRVQLNSSGFLEPLPEGAVGRISTDGTDITQFLLPTGASGPNQITAGADGNLWFTESDHDQIGRITPDGVVTMFPLVGGGGGRFSSAAASRSRVLRTRTIATDEGCA